jgi:chromosome segregation ATPase
MITIEVKGFQSAEDLKFSIDGFTAIVGRSNIGKSALVRALKCALTNSEGVSFVRHGPNCARTLRGVKTCKCFASVHIVTEGFDLLWEKGDAVNRYFFNGEKYDHPGKGLPEFLATNGLAPVKVGDAFKSIQISDQFYPIFLLDQSGGIVAETISDVSRLERINKATKLVEKDRRDVQATKKLREADVDKLRIRLCTYDGLDTALQRVDAVGHQFEAIEAQEGKLGTIKGYILKLQTLVVRVRDLKNVESVEVPTIEAIDRLGPKVDQLSKFSDEYTRREANVTGLKWVEDLEDKVPEIEPISSLGSKLGDLSRFATEHARRLAEVSKLEWIEALEDKVPDIKELKGASDKVTLLSSWITRLKSIKERYLAVDTAIKAQVPDLETLQQLQSKLANLDQLISRSKSLQDSISSLEGELAQVENEETSLEGEISSLGVCPTCVRPLTLDHSHA